MILMICCFIQLLEIEKLLNLESLEDNNDANSGNGNQPMQDQTSKKASHVYLFITLLDITLCLFC